MKNSTTAFDKFLSPYKTKENLAKENRDTKSYELSFVTELCNTYNCEADVLKQLQFRLMRPKQSELEEYSAVTLWSIIRRSC